MVASACKAIQESKPLITAVGRVMVIVGTFMVAEFLREMQRISW